MLEVPSELAGPLPRKVQMSEGDDARYALVIILLFFVGGSAILVWNCYYDGQTIPATGCFA